MNKTIIVVVIVAVAVFGSYFLLRGTYQPAAPVSQPSTSVTQTPATEGKVVTYADSGYSPSTVTVKKGETVTFKNQSSNSMWTASAVHPTHKGYPTTGGCLGSTFDACKGVQPGGSWSFRLDISGTWKYHNHLSPGDIGTIVVE